MPNKMIVKLSVGIGALLVLECAIFAHSQHVPGTSDDEDFVFPREGSGQRAPSSGGIYRPAPVAGSSGSIHDYGSLVHGGRGSSPYGAAPGYGAAPADGYGYGSVAHGPDGGIDDDEYGSGDYYDDEDYDDYLYHDDYEDEEPVHGVSVAEAEPDRRGDTAGGHATDAGGGYHDPAPDAGMTSHDIGVVHAVPPPPPRQPDPLPPTHRPDPAHDPLDNGAVYGSLPGHNLPPGGNDDFLEDWETAHVNNINTNSDLSNERDNGLVVAPDVAVPAGSDDNRVEDGTVDGEPVPTPPAGGASNGMGAKALDRDRSFFAQPGILAAVVGGAVVGLLCAILLVMLIVYRMRKKDEGSYALDEPKRALTGNSYAKNNNREFYA